MSFALSTSVQGTDFSTKLDSYHKASSAHLASARQATRSIMEQGTREDVSTGKTPRKRTWNYVDEWELTESRDVIIKSWKAPKGHQVGNEPLPDQRTPLLQNCDAAEAENIPTDKSSPTPKAHHEEAEASESSDSALATSIASSSSSSSIPGPHPVPGLSKTLGAGLTGLPAIGTLTDRPTNIVMHRRPRRVR